MTHPSQMLAAASSKGLDWAGMGQSAVKVALVGLLFGAGLPMVFAFGMRMLDAGTTTEHEDGTVTKGSPIHLVGAALCFLLVAAAVVCGLLLVMRKTINHYTGWDPFPGMS